MLGCPRVVKPLVTDDGVTKPSDSCMTVRDLCGAAPVACPGRAFFFFFLLCEKRSHCLALAVESAVSGRSHTAKLLCQVGPKNPSKTKQYMIQYCVYGVSGSS